MAASVPEPLVKWHCEQPSVATQQLNWDHLWFVMLAYPVGSDIDMPVILGDYYYIRAGNELISLELANCSLGLTQ